MIGWYQALFWSSTLLFYKGPSAASFYLGNLTCYCTIAVSVYKITNLKINFYQLTPESAPVSKFFSWIVNPIKEINFFFKIYKEILGLP